ERSSGFCPSSSCWYSLVVSSSSLRAPRWRPSSTPCSEIVDGHTREHNPPATVIDWPLDKRSPNANIPKNSKHPLLGYRVPPHKMGSDDTQADEFGMPPERSAAVAR